MAPGAKVLGDAVTVELANAAPDSREARRVLLTLVTPVGAGFGNDSRPGIEIIAERDGVLESEANAG